MKIGAGAGAPDFDHPLEMLEACHERIEERIDTLQRLLAHLGAHGCDEQARQAAQNVMRYFDTAGEHHHADEEVNLFPALAGDSDAAVLIERLRREHARMRSLWQTLRAPLARIAEGTSGQLDPALVDEFGLLYRDHIALEEAELFPRAERALAQPALDEIGSAMARRRGVRT